MPTDLRTDVHGNQIASVGHADGPTLMFAGHCDQIGLLVSHVDEHGFLYAQTIGGWDPQQLVGQAMTVWTANGPIAAVISRKPIHLLSPEEQNAGGRRLRNFGLISELAMKRKPDNSFVSATRSRWN